MYGITCKDQFVTDNMTDPLGEPRRGVLVFKKKTNAVTECDALNDLITTKKTKPYSVSKITDVENMPDLGFIIDGVWKKKL
jgi:hypothetical protein